MDGLVTAKLAWIDASALVPVTGHSTCVSQRKREICVNHNPLELAYTMLSDFKSGKLISDIEMSDEQINWIRILSQDLLPEHAFNPELAADALLKVAHEDTQWNHAAQKTITECYSLRESNQLDKVKTLQNDFAEKCPSVWYKQIVESV
jgi:hypothetical protein